MVPIGELKEVILYVEDMSRQVSFYRDRMGFKVVWPKNVKNLSKEAWVELDTGTCTLALHDRGKRRLGEDAPKIVFRVSNIGKAWKQLQEKGVKLSKLHSPAPGIWVCDGVEPEGNKFSLESRER